MLSCMARSSVATVSRSINGGFVRVGPGGADGVAADLRPAVGVARVLGPVGSAAELALARGGAPAPCREDFFAMARGCAGGSTRVEMG